MFRRTWQIALGCISSLLLVPQGSPGLMSVRRKQKNVRRFSLGEEFDCASGFVYRNSEEKKGLPFPTFVATDARRLAARRGNLAELGDRRSDGGSSSLLPFSRRSASIPNGLIVDPFSSKSCFTKHRPLRMKRAHFLFSPISDFPRRSSLCFGLVPF